MKEVISFIQTCSWYRRFIENCAKITKPLTDLTKKTVVWKWEKALEISLNALKEKLTTAPVLKEAQDNMSFVVKTDASSYAIGAVLLQGEGKDERSIEFGSRLLSSAERNYSTTERGALAIVWACVKFRGYIEGEEVLLVTDHQPLKWLLTIKTHSGRIAR